MTRKKRLLLEGEIIHLLRRLLRYANPNRLEAIEVTDEMACLFIRQIARRRRELGAAYSIAEPGKMTFLRVPVIAGFDRLRLVYAL